MRYSDPNETQVSTQGEGRARQRYRTQQAILRAARELLKAGQVPSVPEAAEAALVSRATAYRYFSSQTELMRGLMDEQMEEVHTTVESLPDDPAARMEALVRADYRMRQENEAQLRTWLRLSVEQRGNATKADGEEPVPRGWRIPAIDEALAPLREELTAERFRRLEVAVSTLVGTEAFLVLKDLWALEGAEAEEVLVWASRALLERARQEE